MELLVGRRQDINVVISRKQTFSNVFLSVNIVCGNLQVGHMQQVACSFSSLYSICCMEFHNYFNCCTIDVYLDWGMLGAFINNAAVKFLPSSSWAQCVHFSQIHTQVIWYVYIYFKYIILKIFHSDLIGLCSVYGSH
jgi:hypothetical protein